MFILFILSQSGRVLEMYLCTCQTAEGQTLVTFSPIRQTASLVTVLRDRLLFLAEEESEGKVGINLSPRK